MSTTHPPRRLPRFTTGEMIRKVREDMAWRQQDLADRLHCERTTIAGWENNTHKAPYPALVMIANLTGCDVEIFTETDDRAQPGGRVRSKWFRRPTPEMQVAV